MQERPLMPFWMPFWNLFKENGKKHGATGILTKIPIFMVITCLLASVFFAYHSGFVDGTSIKPGDEPSLNVNGDLDVYLPEGSPGSGEHKRGRKELVY